MGRIMDILVISVLVIISLVPVRAQCDPSTTTHRAVPATDCTITGAKQAPFDTQTVIDVVLHDGDEQNRDDIDNARTFHAPEGALYTSSDECG